MLRIMVAAWTAACLVLAGPSQSAASAPTPEQAAYLAAMQRLEGEVQGEKGDVHLAGPKVTLRLGETYQFYDQNEARRILIEAWGNPPAIADGVLGMIFPAERSFMDDTWGAVVRYAADGYVSDSDAREIDYDALLADLQNSEDAENRERKAAGYPSVHLVGWAQSPSYDARSHSMIWAKELRFDGDPTRTLNYDLRVLGRRGVLSMNIVSVMPELPQVKQAAEELMITAAFDEGARYADYRAGDRKAAYGLAGLVAGGAAAAFAKKAGILGVLFMILKKGGVFLLAGIAAAFGWLKSLLGRKKAAASPPMPSPEAAPLSGQNSALETADGQSPAAAEDHPS